jgi:hypothetical protein
LLPVAYPSYASILKKLLAEVGMGVILILGLLRCKQRLYRAKVTAPTSVGR